MTTNALGVPRGKAMGRINDCGHHAAASCDGLVYRDPNWRKGGGATRMIEIGKRGRFRQRQYCGGLS